MTFPYVSEVTPLSPPWHHYPLRSYLGSVDNDSYPLRSGQSRSGLSRLRPSGWRIVGPALPRLRPRPVSAVFRPYLCLRSLFCVMTFRPVAGPAHALLAKDCFGLDQSQVRLHTAIARHTRAGHGRPGHPRRHRRPAASPYRYPGPSAGPGGPGASPGPGTIPLTVPETRRLLAGPSPPGRTAHWSAWTRRHQARARWYHQRTRLARDAEITRNGEDAIALGDGVSYLRWLAI